MQRNAGQDESEFYQTFPVQRLIYDVENNKCTVDQLLPVGIIVSPAYQSFWKKNRINWGWPRLSTVLDVILKPIKYLTIIGPIIDYVLNRKLTQVGLHWPPNIYFVEPYKIERINQENIANVQNDMKEMRQHQEDRYEGKWCGFSIAIDEGQIKNDKGKEKEASQFSQLPMQVNAFLLNSRPTRLHINMHGLGSSGNSYDAVAPKASKKWQADQWNVTRIPGSSFKNHKQQVRQIIAAAIQSGYTDIRLDGYSFGAGLVRTVYHELIEDNYCRDFLEKNKITLHYTARNGYHSEGLTILSYLTGFGEQNSRNYKKKGKHAPRPNWLMRAGHFVIHHILRIDTLRTRKISRPIPESSHNYVVNAVLSSVDDTGKKIVMRDGVIGYTNRTSGEKHGHTCIDGSFSLQRDKDSKKKNKRYTGFYTETNYRQSSSKPYRRHWVPVMERELFHRIDKKILEDISIKNALSEQKAKKKLLRLQHTILLHTKWRVKRGQPINYNYGRIRMRVPTRVKQQLDVITKAHAEEQRVKTSHKGQTHWRAAFFKIAEISRKAAEHENLNRARSTQSFYDSTKTAALLNEYTRK